MRQQEDKILNRAELAFFFGVAKTTIDSWVRRGCPVKKKAEGRGKQAQFDTVEVFRWAINNLWKSSIFLKRGVNYSSINGPVHLPQGDNKIPNSPHKHKRGNRK